jgi:hypothetical protein
MLASLLLGRFFLPLVLLTVVGLGISGALASVMLYAPKQRRTLILIGLVLVGLSALQWLLLIWFPALRKIHWITRTWWIPAVASVAVAHLIVLHRAPSRGDWIERLTPWCVGVFAALLCGLALRPVFAELPGDLYLLLMLPPAAGAVIGSLVAYGRFWRDHVSGSGAAGAVRGLLRAVSYVVVFLTGLYLGQITTTRTMHFPSALAGMPQASIEAQLRQDLPRLHDLCAGLDDLRAAQSAVDEMLRVSIEAGRKYYKPEEEDRLRAIFRTYRALRIGLLRTMSMYAGFEAVENRETQARCFLAGFTASASVLQVSLELVRNYRNDAMVREKLNEGARGVRAGEFDTIEERVAGRETIEHFLEMARHFENNVERWRREEILPPRDFDWIEPRARAAIAYVKANRIDSPSTWARAAWRRAKQDARGTAYSAQMLSARFINDVRVVEQSARIDDTFITERIAPKLKPGDILLERRNWYLANAFLPGFWPHGLMYVGTEDDLRELGILEEIRGLGEVTSNVLSTPGNTVRIKPLDAFLRPAPSGRRHAVIEGISEGVVFSSLQKAIHTDYVAVLRPRLSREKIGRAIVRAFSHYGKPYDFEFDFFSADKLVCTELIYRAYEGKGFLQLPLVRMMGRDTLPADEIVRIFTKQRKTLSADQRQLSLVMVVDWDPKKRRLYIHADEDIFSKTVDRPSAFME